jgi:hypothetical protein
MDSMRSSILDALKGTWQTEDQDSRAIVEVSEKHGKPSINVFDKVDGEKFRVSNVRIDRDGISYEVYVPSTKYKTRNKLMPDSKNCIKIELTLTERWERVKK